MRGIIMKKFSVVAMILTVSFGTPCFGQEQLEGLTKDKSSPPGNKLYEDNLHLPDDANKLFLPDDAYLHWPLPAGEEAYASVDGMAIKKVIPEITAISRKSRDDGNQFWGRIAGTVYDRMVQDWVEQRLAIEPRKYPHPGCRRRSADGRQHGWS